MADFNSLLEINAFSSDPEARRLAAEALQRNFNFELTCLHLDPSVQFAHNGKGCTIAASKISAGAVIFQNVTIGANQTYNHATAQWENLGNPVIGKNVIIADGAKIVGPIIIGDNSVIGTGAIITKDVPANSIAYGVNRFKPRDPNYSPVFYKDMPHAPEIVAACEDVVSRYAKLTDSTH
ncbi:serine acetyltransferase [Lacticaseibacillus brantae]|uniref:Galactoside O-acetyltransferase n=1 Tax=Lacticaseibacillus brantae DSM 23927 TaxID=1423727 RepID=A0A0R2B1G1_9LACO|nr:serine acetyltransferase [Lacticaseibacillus brantae]KRM71812.1 galactoside O-acetyltransferase [Lacticaseibacillus brantae DSM 23927]